MSENEDADCTATIPNMGNIGNLFELLKKYVPENEDADCTATMLKGFKTPLYEMLVCLSNIHKYINWYLWKSNKTAFFCLTDNCYEEKHRITAKYTKN